ncbi:MAG: hypothetical protein ACFB5Z_00320 [Elainellaceae cyanobacterium]
MTKYWAIAVGINQYSFLKPLMYAERDAAAIYRYCVDGAEFSADRCQLLTRAALQSDNSGDDSGLVSAERIYQSLEEIAQRAAEDDLIWFAFSGYGLCDGDEDYLLAADSNPENPATAVALSRVMKTLHQAAASSVLLVDLKSLGLPSDVALGKSTLIRAEQLDVPVILSGQPGQQSHETLTLRQGLFTAALLESLGHNCIALEQLAVDLGDRLPALSDRHWRPRQDPEVYIPDDRRYQLLVPGKPLENPFPIPEDVSPSPRPAIPERQPPGSPAHGAGPAPTPLSLPDPTVPPKPPIPTLPAPIPQAASSLPSEDPPTTNQAFWRRIAPWGIGLLSLLIFGVVVRNRAALFSAADPPNDRTAVISTVPNDGADDGAAAALASARAAIEAQRYDDALEWLDTVPPAAQDREYAQLQQLARTGANQAAPEGDLLQVNAEILAQAIASLNQEREETPVNQASDFARAIAIAERIQPGQPLYDEAQSYIRRWGNTVIDLAEARAQSGNYVDAIGAARLIPPSVAVVHERAQARIQQWEQQLGQGSTQQSLLASAEALIQPNQASSYNEAIAHLRLIERRDADYAQAQDLIDRWSSDILDLAHGRAYEGRFTSAISAASLVPQDATVYVDAREAIADWQWQADNYGDSIYTEPVYGEPVYGEPVYSEPTYDDYDEQVGTLPDAEPYYGE